MIHLVSVQIRGRRGPNCTTAQSVIADVAGAYIPRHRDSGLLLLEHTRIDHTDDDEAGDNQGQSNEGDKKDTAPAGRKFATDDPILGFPGQPLHSPLDHEWACPYLCLKITPATHEKYQYSDAQERSS